VNFRSLSLSPNIFMTRFAKARVVALCILCTPSAEAARLSLDKGTDKMQDVLVSEYDRTLQLNDGQLSKDVSIMEFVPRPLKNKEKRGKGGNGGSSGLVEPFAGIGEDTSSGNSAFLLQAQSVFNRISGNELDFEALTASMQTFKRGYAALVKQGDIEDVTKASGGLLQAHLNNGSPAQKQAAAQKLAEESMEAGTHFLESSTGADVPDQCKSNPAWKQVCVELGKDNRAYTVTIGNREGRQFWLQSQGHTMWTPGAAWSLGKWVGSACIGGVVSDKRNKLSFDSKPQDFLPWWKPTSKKAKITLMHLLSFTSGIDPGDDKAGLPCLEHASLGAKGASYTMEACAKEIYEKSKFHGIQQECGYNSAHHAVAMAMAEAATGKKPMHILYEYLYLPARMETSFYAGFNNPFLAGGLVTTADDMDAFARAYLSNKFMDEPTSAEFDKLRAPTWGGMAMGIQYVKQGFHGHMKDHDIHTWGGGTGYRVMVDRTAGVYVTFTPLVKPPSSGADGVELIKKAMTLSYPVLGAKI